MRRLAYLVAVVLIGVGGSAYGQDADPKDTLQKQLTTQFSLTKMSADRSEVVTAGTVVQLQQGGLTMYTIASPLPPEDTYKNGRMTKSIGRDIAINMALMGNGNVNDLPRHQCAAKDTLWVGKIDVESNKIVFQLYSDPVDGTRYYADLKIPLDKGPFPTPEQALAKVAEVLAVPPPENSAANTQVAKNDPPPPPPVPQPPPVRLTLPAVYTNSQTAGNRLQLNADKTFTLQEGGQPYHGTFTENGNSLELNIAETGPTTVTLQGDNITDASGQQWSLQKQAPPAAPPAATASPVANGPALTNQDIIKMSKAKFGDGVILAKIGKSKCEFDTSPDAMVHLKQSGVSDPVIQAMVSAAR